MNEIRQMTFDDPKDELFIDCRSHLATLLEKSVNVVNNLFKEVKGDNKLLAELDEWTIIVLEKLLPIYNPDLVDESSLEKAYIKYIVEDNDSDFVNKPSYPRFLEVSRESLRDDYDTISKAYQRIKARRDACLYWEKVP